MAKTQLLRLLACFTIFLSLAGTAAAQGFDTRAKQAFMIDADTGTVLFIKDADKLIPPASLGKLMTMEIVFSMLKSGQLTLDHTFAVSENAWRKGGATSGGSTMFAELKSSIRVEDLIQGVVVQSANDGCIILAEGISGSEQNFAELMTKRARELGMTKSVFKNSTGLPADGQVVTVRELAMLAQHIWKEYPEYYKYYSQLQFTWNNITQNNRNPLLAMGIGADGMKTGYTAETGYAIVGSVNRDGRRVFAAMSGMATERERAEEGRKLLEWGIRGFEANALFAANEEIGEAKVYGGEKGSVMLKAKGPISILIPSSNRDRLIARIVYKGPLVAPVEAGTPVGSLKVWVGELLTQETPLFAAEDVGVGTLYQRALDAIGELMIGWLR
ncbi:MAG: D-alanyl-D-alanine carboxypeptidase [Rhizobiaceae bacterium]|nr:D-alanyl-D-alanine carboxypeptidase [Rhizobiaceae bacterium]